MGEAITISVTLPPSVNSLYLLRGRKRVPSRRYSEWRHEAGWELKRQRPTPIDGPWTASIVLPADMRGDIDNRAKALLDLLVLHRIVPDDRHCTALNISKDGLRGSGYAVVTLRRARA
jgi:Holliday junction resolvase RusA-like endonuclease